MQDFVFTEWFNPTLPNFLEFWKASRGQIITSKAGIMLLGPTLKEATIISGSTLNGAGRRPRQGK